MKVRATAILIILSAILLLGAWSQYKPETGANPADASGSTTADRLGYPDDPLDGKLFVEAYTDGAAASDQVPVFDDPVDAAVFYQFYETNGADVE